MNIAAYTTIFCHSRYGMTNRLRSEERFGVRIDFADFEHGTLVTVRKRSWLQGLKLVSEFFIEHPGKYETADDCEV